jgi:hypothetical protein
MMIEDPLIISSPTTQTRLFLRDYICPSNKTMESRKRKTPDSAAFSTVCRAVDPSIDCHLTCRTSFICLFVQKKVL